MEEHPATAVDRTAVLAYRRGVLRFARSGSRDFPWRATRDAYAVLIGEVLLQRTSGRHVEAVFERFLARWPSPDELADARDEELTRVLHPLGLTKRSSVIRRLGIELARRGGVPLRPSLLTELPGIGRYAAHAVPIFVAGRNLPLVDWVIARVLRRYFGLTAERRPNQDEELWRLAAEIARPGRARDVWWGTLDLAARHCRPKPACDECPLRHSCRFPAGG